MVEIHCCAAGRNGIRADYVPIICISISSSINHKINAVRNHMLFRFMEDKPDSDNNTNESSL